LRQTTVAFEATPRSTSRGACRRGHCGPPRGSAPPRSRRRICRRPFAPHARSVPLVLPSSVPYPSRRLSDPQEPGRQEPERPRPRAQRAAPPEQRRPRAQRAAPLVQRGPGARRVAPLVLPHVADRRRGQEPPWKVRRIAWQWCRPPVRPPASALRRGARTLRDRDGHSCLHRHS